MLTRIKEGNIKFCYLLLAGVMALLTPQLASATGAGDCSGLIAGRTYAHQFSGFLNIGQLAPNAGGGYLRFAGNGEVTGLVTFTVGTIVQLADVPVQGTYAVTWDNRTSAPVCAGTATLNNGGMQQAFQVVVNDNGSGIELMHTDLGLATGITALPMHRGSCSNELLASTYTYNAKGWIAPPPIPGFPMPTLNGLIPLAFSGVVSFDGQGNLSGWDTVSLNGLLVPRTFSGGYTMGSNCVATMTMTDTIGNTIHTEVFVLKGAKALLVVNTDPGTVLAFAANRATE